MASTVRVFVGTYTQTTSKGIYVYDVDTDTGVMEYVSHVGGITNPSFLVLTPDARFLYAVGETGDPHGGVFAYAVDASGTLAPLNSQSSGGAGPCSIDVHRSGKAVLVANYGGGSVSSFPVNDDGSLGEAASVIQHTGSSVDQSRQQEPHAHMIRHDLDYNFVFSPDLGTDKVMIYALDPDTAVLTPHGEASVPPGSGPRHIEFHPNRRFAYVINEMGNTITAFAYDGAAGALTAIETVTTLPDGYDEVSHTADIHITDDGRYLYGSNRAARQPRHVRRGRGFGPPLAARHRAHGGREPAELRHRPDRLLRPRRQPELGYGHVSPPRLGHGPAPSLGRRGRNPHGGLPEDDRGGLIPAHVCETS